MWSCTQVLKPNHDASATSGAEFELLAPVPIEGKNIFTILLPICFCFALSCSAKNFSTVSKNRIRTTKSPSNESKELIKESLRVVIANERRSISGEKSAAEVELVLLLRDNDVEDSVRNGLVIDSRNVAVSFAATLLRCCGGGTIGGNENLVGGTSSKDKSGVLVVVRVVLEVNGLRVGEEEEEEKNEDLGGGADFAESCEAAARA